MINGAYKIHVKKP